MTVHLFVDETKRAGYVLAAVTVADPVATRKVLRELVLAGQRRIHMKHEQDRRRRALVSALTATVGIRVDIFDAARRYATEREARAACLSALVNNVAMVSGDILLILEQDDTLISSDRQVLYRASRAVECSSRLVYSHSTAHAESLLALPDIAAWCWARSGDWRRRIRPLLGTVHTV